MKMKLFGRKNKTEGRPDVGRQLVLLIEGMHCTSCGLLIDDELEDVPGVRSAVTDVRAGRALVLLHDGMNVDASALVSVVEAAGDYTARLAD
ncbi:cation transporter [Streptomyces sp. ZAF1911]|uniref:cation transporter n=1 Tax=Streptomyces sp. ZAF1911 TaxID=2944129 RepID=UPI00237BBF99|nr:cation transporter [Streptomyces sp. ZAF1911]MDD9375668.1 cation transporter [Streptomyces sp. ZAF1911]